jgi:3-oxoadipate enol-lactonase
MGGMIAQRYALMNTSDILSLTLACTYAAPNIFCTRRFDYWADVAKHMGVATVMRDVISWAFTHQFFEPAHKAELEESDSAAREVDLTTEEYLSQLNVVQVFDTSKELHKLKGLPVLVLAGEEDILIPTALSHELHKLIPGSEWKTVKGGHCCSWEFHDSFNDALLEFLKNVKS